MKGLVTAVEKRAMSDVSAQRRQELKELAETQDLLKEQGAKMERQLCC